MLLTKGDFANLRQSKQDNEEISEAKCTKKT